MKSKTRNPKQKDDLKKQVKIVDIEETDPIAASAHEELDPEVLAALNAKKTKKKSLHAIDYIPELERDTNDFDLDSQE